MTQLKVAQCHTILHIDEVSQSTERICSQGCRWRPKLDVVYRIRCQLQLNIPGLEEEGWAFVESHSMQCSPGERILALRCSE